MKSLNRKIDSFCWKHPKFGIPKLMLYIIAGNVLVWLFAMMDRTNTLYNLLTFDPALVCRGQVWRIFTFAFIPVSGGGIIFFAISLYFYYFIGTALEREWGAGKFTVYYISGLILLVLYSLILYWITRMRVQVSAAYLNLSLFFAFATLWPEQRVLLFFIIPVKIKWLAWVDAAFFVLEIVRYLLAGYIGLALVPVIAMLTYLVFCGEWLIDFFRPSHVRQKTRTIQFKSAVKKMERERQSRPYTRKCAVCGRTDTENPGLEFRYCSRCAGYHCFCQEHINNHIHFTE